MANTKYLETADAIGARLCRDAIWSGERCNWLGDSMEFVELRWQVIHRTFGPDFYNGTSGIALFLAHLFVQTGDPMFRKTAEGALQCAISRLEMFEPTTGFGFYAGLTGIAYALAECGRIFGDDSYTSKSLELLRHAHSQEPSSSQSWDVVSGSAGVIPILLSLHDRFEEDFLLEAASRHGDLLLQSANRGADGWSWKTIPEPGMQDLTGFSHGTAGIGWSLLEMYNKVKETRFLHAADEALRYERRWYDPQQENWLDFRSRTETGSTVCAMAWCHGAPGIGLSRIRAWRLTQNPQRRQEAEAAVRSTARTLKHSAADQSNFSLCHGNFGNAELLIQASDEFADENYLKSVMELAEAAREKYLVGHNPWPCGVLNGGETPNLMLGLAGIGYFYLRLHDRKKVPSVLIVGSAS
jgi:type 2 lantibiotic biosynthesis protein LanM